MKKRNPINKNGTVRELTTKDIRAMKSAKEVLPADLLTILPERKISQRSTQKFVKIPLTISL